MKSNKFNISFKSEKFNKVLVNLKFMKNTLPELKENYEKFHICIQK